MSKLLWLTGVACGKNIRIIDKIVLDSIISRNNYYRAISCVLIFVLPFRPFWRGGRGNLAKVPHLFEFCGIIIIVKRETPLKTVLAPAMK